MGTTTDIPPSAWLEASDSQHILARECYIGRIEGNHVVIPDHRVSRRHAVVQCLGRRFALVDLGSTNGTFLNDTRIFKPTPLQDGDIIGIGGRRLTFCQPAQAGDEGEDAAASTAVVVAKTACWMLLITLPENAGADAVAWLDAARQAIIQANGHARRLRDTLVFGHWRSDVSEAGRVRSAVCALATGVQPPGARLVLHHGTVRVGGGTGTSEETLLGADVTFVHKLETASADLNVTFLLSAAAVHSLELEARVTPLGMRGIRDMPGTHEVFALRKP